MAKRTQKAGATGRFGARYGVSVRRNAGMAMKKKSAKLHMPGLSIPKGYSQIGRNLVLWKVWTHIRWRRLGTIHPCIRCK